MVRPKSVAAALIPILAAAMVLAVPFEIEAAGRRALAIATWMVLSWILEPMHPALVGFAGCFLFVTAHGAEFDVAFGGFATATPWFLYGALSLVAATQANGGVRRLAAAVPPACATSFPAASATIVGLALLTGALIDSALARASVLVVAALAVSTRLDQRMNVKSRLPLVAAASYTAAVLGADGASAPPSIAWRLVTVAICVALAARFVRPAIDVVPEEQSEGEATGRTLALLGAAVAGWATVRWHGVSPAVVGLAAGLAAAFPGLRRPAAGEMKADPLAIILAGTALSVPLVLTETNAAAALVAAVQSWVARVDDTVAARLALYSGHILTELFEPRPDVAGVGQLSLASVAGITPATLQWIGACASTVKFALYQSPALILGAAVAGLTTRDVLKFGVALALAGAVAMLVM